MGQVSSFFFSAGSNDFDYIYNPRDIPELVVTGTNNNSSSNPIKNMFRTQVQNNTTQQTSLNNQYFTSNFQSNFTHTNPILKNPSPINSATNITSSSHRPALKIVCQSLDENTNNSQKSVDFREPLSQVYNSPNRNSTNILKKVQNYATSQYGQSLAATYKNSRNFTKNSPVMSAVQQAEFIVPLIGLDNKAQTRMLMISGKPYNLTLKALVPTQAGNTQSNSTNLTTTNNSSPASNSNLSMANSILQQRQNQLLLLC